MAVYNTTKVTNSRDLLSQTPPNYVEENYHLHELQEKVNADWKYRPNHAIIEVEDSFGSETYQPMEVVLQTVKTDQNNDISDDWRRIVFRNIFEHRKPGQRYRFKYDFDIKAPDREKDVWLAVNQSRSDLTASQVVCKCNGILGSIYVNENGETEYHYEPVVQPMKLSSYGAWANDVAFDPKGAMMLIMQYNKYTSQYFINQRFIFGVVDKQYIYKNGELIEQPYAQVYKITNIQKDYSYTTFEPNDVGTMRIYFDADQLGELDDIEHRIANNEVVPKPKPKDPVIEDETTTYSLEMTNPTLMPAYLGKTDFEFELQVKNNKDEIIDTTIGELPLELTGNQYAFMANVDDYVSIEKIDNGKYKLHRKKADLNLSVRFTAMAVVDSQELKLSFDLRLWGRGI